MSLPQKILRITLVIFLIGSTAGLIWFGLETLPEHSETTESVKEWVDEQYSFLAELTFITQREEGTLLESLHHELNFRPLQSSGMEIELDNCLTHVYRQTDIIRPGNSLTVEISQLLFEEVESPTCNNPADLRVTSDYKLLEEPFAHYFSPDRIYNYPFDRRTMSVTYWFKAVTPEEETIFIAPGLFEVIADTPEWNAAITIENIQAPNPEFEFLRPFSENPQNAVKVTIDLVRPLSTRILTVALLFGLALFIIILVFMPDSGSALEVSVGILLGLWGVQEILIPSDFGRPNLVHSAIVFLYLLFTWAIVTRFIVLPLFKRTQVKKANILPPDVVPANSTQLVLKDNSTGQTTPNSGKTSYAVTSIIVVAIAAVLAKFLNKKRLPTYDE